MSTGSIQRHSYDAVIVGARPAGAATAVLLAREGARVLVIDRQGYGSDTISTHALMRGGVMQLRRLGLLDWIVATGAQPVTRTLFQYGDEEVSVDIRPEHGIAALYAPRRTVLDAGLADLAWQAGAEVQYGVTAGELTRAPSGRVTGLTVTDRTGTTQTITAGLVIGADGRRSTIARLAGASTYRIGRHRTACVYGYFSGLPNLGYRWLSQPGVSIGAVPTNRGEHCVFVLVPPERFLRDMLGDLAAGFHGLVAEFPGFAAAMQGAKQSGRLTGFAGANGYFRQSFGPGWALVGDAGYFKDPVTAHGITDALRDAELLAAAVMAGGDAALAGYQAERDALSLPFFETTEKIASFGWDLETLKGLHADLHQAMKAEVGRLAAATMPVAAAA